MVGAGRARLVGGVSVLRVLLLAAMTALSGCSREAPPDALFPLGAGHRWSYRVVTQWSDGRAEQDALALTTFGEEPLPAEVAGSAGASGWRRRGDDGIDYWLRADASGIRRLARRALLDPAARADPPQRYVLKAPYVVGTTWEASTTAYLLTRKFEFPREVRHTYAAVPMNYRIEAEGESVDTPAGRYTGCLRVRGTASMRVYADPVREWLDVPLTTLEWYCRGVGLVRLERTELAPSSFMTGGTRILELQSFR